MLQFKSWTFHISLRYKTVFWTYKTTFDINNVLKHSETGFGVVTLSCVKRNTHGYQKFGHFTHKNKNIFNIVAIYNIVIRLTWNGFKFSCLQFNAKYDFITPSYPKSSYCITSSADDITLLSYLAITIIVCVTSCASNRKYKSWRQQLIIAKTDLT